MTRLLLIAALSLALGGNAFASSSSSSSGSGGSSTTGSSSTSSSGSTSSTSTTSTTEGFSGPTQVPANGFDESYQPGVSTKPNNTYLGEFGVPAEKRFIPFSADLPGCEDHDTVWWIKNRFDHTQSTFWNSSLEIVNIDRIREIGFRSNGESYIPRRYCMGRAELNDKKFHTVFYQIQERTGVAGYSDGFEWCVVGFDHDFAYAPACSVLRPLIDRYANDKYVLPTAVAH